MTRREQILQFIRKSIKEQGFAPTYREIGEAVGLKSPASVSKQLAALEREGKIERPFYGSARAIRVKEGRQG